MFRVLPDDPLITEMDPIQRMYMFYHWIQDEKEKTESLKNQAYLIGGFSNPQMLQKIIEQENGKNMVSSTDEDFEKSLKMVKEDGLNKEEPQKRRKRRKKIGT